MACNRSVHMLEFSLAIFWYLGQFSFDCYTVFIINLRISFHSRSIPHTWGYNSCCYMIASNNSSTCYMIATTQALSRTCLQTPKHLWEMMTRCLDNKRSDEDCWSLYALWGSHFNLSKWPEIECIWPEVGRKTLFIRLISWQKLVKYWKSMSKPNEGPVFWNGSGLPDPKGLTIPASTFLIQD